MMMMMIMMKREKDKTRFYFAKQLNKEHNIK